MVPTGDVWNHSIGLAQHWTPTMPYSITLGTPAPFWSPIQYVSTHSSPLEEKISSLTRLSFFPSSLSRPSAFLNFATMEGEDAADLEDSFVSRPCHLSFLRRAELTWYFFLLLRRRDLVSFSRSRFVWFPSLFFFFSRFLLLTYRFRKLVLVVSFYLRILHLTPGSLEGESERRRKRDDANERLLRLLTSPLPMLAKAG